MGEQIEGIYNCPKCGNPMGEMAYWKQEGLKLVECTNETCILYGFGLDVEIPFENKPPIVFKGSLTRKIITMALRDEPCPFLLELARGETR
jgi:hypothetical protein